MATYRVHLDKSDTPHEVAIDQACRHFQLTEPALSCAEIITIAHEDHTYIDGPDELVGAQLLAVVRNAVEDE